MCSRKWPSVRMGGAGCDKRSRSCVRSEWGRVYTLSVEQQLHKQQQQNSAELPWEMSAMETGGTQAFHKCHACHGRRFIGCESAAASQANSPGIFLLLARLHSPELTSTSFTTSGTTTTAQFSQFKLTLFELELSQKHVSVKGHGPVLNAIIC